MFADNNIEEDILAKPTGNGDSIGHCVKRHTEEMGEVGHRENTEAWVIAVSWRWDGSPVAMRTGAKYLQV